MASPSKRAKLSPSLATVVVSKTPALLEVIASFIPFSLTIQEYKKEKKRRADKVLQTIVSFCRAVPGVGDHLGPENEGFWRPLVLRQFDFSIDPLTSFNVEDTSGIAQASLDAMRFEMLQQQSEEEEGEEELVDVWDDHPAKPAVDAWNATHSRELPDQILQNDLAFWPHIGVLFRPVEYQFLSDIQAGKIPMAAWPAHENGFTLYCDLLLMKNYFTTFKAPELQTWADSEQAVFPCLLGRLKRELAPRGLELLEHCDIAPHYWSVAPSRRWDRFDRRSSTQLVSDQLVDDSEGQETDYDSEGQETDFDDECPDPAAIAGRTNQEATIFPLTYIKKYFDRLARMVFRSCSDWRRVHVDSDEAAGPEFYIGPTKRSGRWVGFVGQSDFDGGDSDA